MISVIEVHLSRAALRIPSVAVKSALMKVLEGKRALLTLTRGMSELAKLVSVTYGPNGAKVAVAKQGRVRVTTDGSSLAREVRFQGYERLGVSLVRSATSLVDGSTGDGTSTTVLLANAIVQAALDQYTPRTWDPRGLVREMREYLPAVESLINDISREPDEGVLRRVAYMASHGDDAAVEAVVPAVLRVGETGTVLIQPGDGVGIETDYRDGLLLDAGWAAHSMGKGDGGDRVFEGPLVSVVNRPLSTFEDVRTLMEEASQWPGRGLVLFCPKLTGDALTTLVLNDSQGVLPCIAVTYTNPSPYEVHDWMGDVAAVTGSVNLGPDCGDDHRAFQAEWLGSARKVTVGRDRTEILSYPDAEDRIAVRVEELLLRAGNTSSDYDRDRYRSRAAAMDGGLCILKVGGYTNAEAVERRSRVEDALHAVRETLTTGVVPGAGRAFQIAGLHPGLLGTPGGRVLARALEEPLRVLCARAGVPFSVLPEVPPDDPWTGWCPVRGGVVDFGDAPAVVDPTGVVLGALRAAVSVACEVLLVEVVLSR
jgi:chaperonin GroEL